MGILMNIGNKIAPIDLGHGVLAYKHDGHWLYRDTQAKGRKGRKFIKATNAELILELEKRGLAVLYPGHECVDHPNLPCPACEMDSLRALGLVDKRCG
jgi:hypothetical protein